MLWKVISRVSGRIALFGFCGMIFMLIVGACEGAVAGGALGMTLTGSPVGSAGEGAMLGAITGATSAGTIGGITGVLSFGIVGGLTSRRNDQDFLLNNVMLWAARGSAVGVVLGAICGVSTAILLGISISKNIRGVTGDYLFPGYILGVIAGFIIGTFVGALYGAFAKKFQPAESLPSTCSGVGASP
jgi:hypothetical protein